jgi:hypothetical protein
MPKVTIVTPSIRPEGLVPVMNSLERQTNQDFEWLVEVGMPWKGHDLNAAMNRMLKRAAGEVVISIQDYISVPPETVAKALELYAQYPQGFTTFPMGKIQPNGDIKFDWRAGGDYRRIAGYEWETDFAMAPLDMFKAIGGYDEAYDAGWSWDNASVGVRAELAGFVPSCYPALKGIGIDHDAVIQHPFRGKNENGKLHSVREKEYRDGNWKLGYL